MYYFYALLIDSEVLAFQRQGQSLSVGVFLSRTNCDWFGQRGYPPKSGANRSV